MTTKQKLVLVLAIIYCISPVDFMPGIAVDDIIVALIASLPFLKANKSGNEYEGDDND